MKTLLVISGGIEAIPGIQRAREMGLFVVVSDGNPDAPGFEFADDRIVVSTYDVVATLRAALEYHKNRRLIDGVICVASDVPLTVATIAEALNLPGIPVKSARLAMDKLAMKERFVEAGIPVPWFHAVEGTEHLRRLVKEHGYDLVIKPVDSRGARGVLNLSNSVDLDWAFEQARMHSPSSRVMVEAFLAGPQISTESILLGEQAMTPGFADRNYEFLERYAPYIIENGGHQPTILSNADKRAVSDLAVRAARAMGIQVGTAKGDIVFASEGPKVIEMAARLSGGWFCTDQVPIATGVDFVGIAIRIALGEEIDVADLTPKWHRGAAIRYFFPPPGRVTEIRNCAAFRNVGWVHRLGFFLQPGEILESVTDHTKRAGFIITTGDSREEAVRRAGQVVDTIEILTERV